MDARSLAAALNGEVVGPDRVLAPGPGHSRTDRSMSIRLDSDAPDGFLVHSFAGDDWRRCRDHIRAAIGLGRARNSWRRTLARPQRTRVVGLTAPTTTASALAIWDRGGDARGSIIERYLKRRKLALPDGDSVIRYVPDIGPRGEPNAIMVALMRNVVTDEPVAVLRTYVSHTATKTHRKFLGPSRGAAIKFAPASDVFFVAEGLETALAASAAGMNPVWAMGSAGAIGSFWVLENVAKLVILAEIDGGASRDAVSSCTRRWCASGKQVFVVTPKIGEDFADVWKELGAEWREGVESERVQL
jgi:putative DNA primase/helicase